MDYLFKKNLKENIKKLQIKKIRGIERIHWNYYSKGQEGVGHVDRDEDRYISILYNPLTTDGGTEIKKVFYPDIAGQAKVFKSNWLAFTHFWSKFDDIFLKS